MEQKRYAHRLTEKLNTNCLKRYEITLNLKTHTKKATKTVFTIDKRTDAGLGQRCQIYSKKNALKKDEDEMVISTMHSQLN